MLRTGGAGMNVVNQSKREGVLSMKAYTMIHLLRQEALQLAMIKSSLVDIEWFAPNMNAAFYSWELQGQSLFHRHGELILQYTKVCYRTPAII